MSRTLLSGLIVSLALVAPSQAQEWARKMFDSLDCDFGTCARGAKIEHEFVITNIYKEDAHIADVRSSCGCTTPRITKDTLKTYEKSAIVATFNTKSFLGQRHATLTVVFDKPFYAEVQLQVKGYVRSDIVLNPGGVELGSVDQGTQVAKKIAVNYAGRSDWRIVDVKSGNPHLVAKIVETQRQVGQVSYELEVKLKDDAPSGMIKEQLLLVTNDQRAPEFPVEVEGRVVAELTVSPTSLFMGVLQPGQKVTKQLLVRSKKPFRILGATCDDDCFTIQPGEEADVKHLVPITFVAGDKPGKISQKIQLKTDLGADVIAEFLTYAQIVAPDAKPAPDKAASAK